MNEITHDRCSELLAPYHRGELGADDLPAVEEHLATCEECRSELAGLRALMAGDFEPLRDEERRALHSAVVREARAGRATVSILPARRSFWERHAGQVVGAAASLVVILFAVLVAQGLGGDDSGDGAGGGDASITEGRQGRLGDGAATGGPPPVFAGAQPQPQGATEDAAKDESERSAAFALQERDSFTEDSLAQLGARGAIFRNFAREYDAQEATASAPFFLEQLAVAAPSEEAASQVRTCGGELLAAANPDTPILPAYASLAEVNGRRALILGFVAASTPGGPLQRYSVWAVGATDCDDIVANAFGDIQ